ncbi:MAG: ATP-binding cassette domain-containing protein [Planctomycetota bacterium]|nr:MAG: ATP-binding cassette domain-containing protein [Planctomycetota bacterium]
MSERAGPESASAPRTVLEVQRLTVESLQGDGLHTIFHDASLSLPAGEVVLLVGPSGSGKTLLTKLLAGLIDRGSPRLRIGPNSEIVLGLRSGERVRVLGPNGRYPARLRGALGYMFQYHALFDELTVRDNIRFGADMASDPLPPDAFERELQQLARELKLEHVLDAPIDALSGGQKQRTALLRMLALRPEILIYDEPTSGLDPDASARVAARIRQVQHHGPAEVRPGMSLVVTHDYPSLLGVADRVVLIDPRRGFEVHPVRSDAEREALRSLLAEALHRWQAPPPRPIPPRDRTLLRDRAAWHRLRTAPGRLFDLLRATPRLLARSARWHRRFAASIFGLLVLGALPFTALAGLAIGLVVSYFSLNSVPQQLQGQLEPIFIEEILRGLGLALYQILAPLLAAICLTARSGAAIAGHLSHMERSSQLDALRVLGMPPWVLLGDKVVLSFMVGMPLHAAVCFATASLAALLVVLATRPLVTWYTFSHSYMAGLGAHVLDLPYTGSGWLLAKLVPAGLLCGLLAWRQGVRPKRDATDVNRAITGAIMQGILCVIAVFFVVLLFEVQRRRAGG